MNRRDCLGTMLGTAVAVFGTASAGQSLPKRKRVRVAFLLGDSANVIDTAGPWEVFQDTMLDGMLMHSHPFELYTVAPTDAMLRMTGGLQVVPNYTPDQRPAAQRDRRACAQVDARRRWPGSSARAPAPT